MSSCGQTRQTCLYRWSIVRKPRVNSYCKIADERVAFLIIFHANHPGSPLSSAVQFRTRLLQFAVLFTRRSTPRTTSNRPLPALLELRTRNRASSQAYLAHRADALDIDTGLLSSRLPIPDAATDANRRHALASSSLCKPPNLYGTSTSVSLLDTLPAFMALSAVQNAMQESDITALWMHLAARYMAQAVLEQYSIYGAKESDTLLYAFAWGFDADSTAEEGSDDWEVNVMFSGEEGEVPEWAGIRNHYINLVKVDEP